MSILELDVKRYREPEHPVDAVFLKRWSPRALSGEAISRAELMGLFEAAKWAPSSYNNQPWRFIYAMRDSAHWTTFFDLLSSSNQAWCVNAAALIVVASKKTLDNGKPSTTHLYDSGAAWAYFALQATMKGLVAHGMQGFDYERARTALKIPEEYDIAAMAAVGNPGEKEELPEKLREREAPSSRKPLAQIVFEGTFHTIVS